MNPVAVSPMVFGFFGGSPSVLQTGQHGCVIVPVGVSGKLHRHARTTHDGVSIFLWQVGDLFVSLRQICCIGLCLCQGTPFRIDALTMAACGWQHPKHAWYPNCVKYSPSFLAFNFSHDRSLANKLTSMIRPVSDIQISGFGGCPTKNEPQRVPITRAIGLGPVTNVSTRSGGSHGNGVQPETQGAGETFTS